MAAYTFYLELAFDFEKDINIDEFEKVIGVKADRKTSLANSKGTHKTAKIRWNTHNISEWNTGEIIEKYVEKIAPRLENIGKYIEEYDGSGGICLVFTHMKDRPIIGLTKKTIELMAKYGLDFYVDYM